MPHSARRSSTRRNWRCSRAPNERLTLVPRDTGGTAEGAARAARAAIGDGAQLILGPLLAAEVQAVKPIARDAHLNIIAFSTVAQKPPAATPF